MHQASPLTRVGRAVCEKNNLTFAGETVYLSEKGPPSINSYPIGKCTTNDVHILDETTNSLLAAPVYSNQTRKAEQGQTPRQGGNVTRALMPHSTTIRPSCSQPQKYYSEEVEHFKKEYPIYNSSQGLCTVCARDRLLWAIPHQPEKHTKSLPTARCRLHGDHRANLPC